MSAEHLRPLAAFALVCAVAGVIMASGLRTPVEDALIGAGAPPVVVTAVAPDRILGHALDNAPQPPAARPQAPRGTTPSSGSADDVDIDVNSDPDSGSTAAESADPTDNRPVSRPRAADTVNKPDPAAGPAAPGDIATSHQGVAPTPVPKPLPTPVPGQVPGPRPGFVPAPTPVPLTPLLSRKGPDDDGQRGGWGHDRRDHDRRDHERRDHDKRDHDKRDHDKRDHDKGRWDQDRGVDSDRGQERDRGAYDPGDRQNHRGDRGRSGHGN